MVLHIGCDEFVPLSSVVAVLDVAMTPGLLEQTIPVDSAPASVRKIGDGEVKTVIVTSSNGHSMFFLSPISAQTLYKRTESGFNERGDFQ